MIPILVLTGNAMAACDVTYAAGVAALAAVVLGYGRWWA